MSNLFIFLAGYLIAGIIFWASYIPIRSRITKKTSHVILFLVDLIFGLALLTLVPIYFYFSGVISTPLIILLALVMGVIAVLHHLSILEYRDVWTGIMLPRGLRVSKGHGPIIHAAFAVLYAVYGLTLFIYMNGRAQLLSETLVLFGSVILIESMSCLGMLEALRMWYSRKS